MDFEKHGFKFILTCGACPEQYDVINGRGQKVAYIRLRWGTLSVSVPDVGGERIHEKIYNDSCLGLFPDQEERENQLNLIADKLKELKGK